MTADRPTMSESDGMTPAALLEQALEQWAALVEREESEAYKVGPPPLPPPPLLLAYHESPAPSPQQHPRHDDGPEGPAPAALATAPRGFVCPPAWRERICEWCFRVVDHCDIERDVVSVAVFYFDRYVSRHGPSAFVGEALFQLVAMTSLYLAVKLHSTKKISAASMSSLSQGRFRVDQILKMETCIISGLSWRLNPPTAALYLGIAEPLIAACTDDDEQMTFEVYELSRYLLELSVCDGYFADKRPSSLARGAIDVAMEVLAIPRKAVNAFDAYGLGNSPETTEQCAQRLRSVYHLAMAAGEDERAGSSPTTVFGHIY